MSPTKDDIPETPIRTLFEKAQALRAAARWEDAAQSYDAVLARLDADSDRESEIVLQTLYLKISCLDEQGDSQGTLAACDALLVRYGASEDHKTIGFVADALSLKSRALSRLGKVEQERMVLRQLIEQYAAEPRARSQVARAMYNEGIYLRATQRGDQAIEMWDQLFLRFGTDPPASARFIPIKGQLAKSRYLAETNRLDAALVTCNRMLKECSRLDLPETRVAEVRRATHGCMAAAQRSKGLRERIRAMGKRRREATSAVIERERSLGVEPASFSSPDRPCDRGFRFASRRRETGCAPTVDTTPCWRVSSRVRSVKRLLRLAALSAANIG